MERGGRTVARLPYVVRGPRRMRVLTQPPLTQTLGPWVEREEGSKPSTALADELELLAALEAGLPRGAGLPPGLLARDAQRAAVLLGGLPARGPLHVPARGPGLRGGPVGRARAATSAARSARPASGSRSATTSGSTASTTSTPRRSSARASRCPTRSPRSSASTPPARRGTRARCCSPATTPGAVHAVAYVVWDRSAAYYLMGGGDPELRTSGASSLLMWEAIMRARGGERRLRLRGLDARSRSSASSGPSAAARRRTCTSAGRAARPGPPWRSAERGGATSVPSHGHAQGGGVRKHDGETRDGTEAVPGAGSNGGRENGSRRSRRSAGTPRRRREHRRGSG